jgi:hypothetical protein
MADIAGLFQTPEQYQLAQRQAQDAQAIQYANLDPRAKADYGFYSAGQQLAGAIGGALGGQDPQLQLISRRQALASQLDQTDPNSFMRVAQLAAQSGDPQFAMSIADAGRQMQASMATARKTTAEAQKAELSNAQETKLRDELSQLPPDASEADILSIVTKYGSPDKVLAALQRSREMQNQIETKKDIAAEKIQAQKDRDLEKAQTQKERDQAQRDFEERMKKLDRESKDALLRLSSSLRPPTPASVTTIVDPTNPNQMLSIDTRQYKGGGIGASGVIGISGKEPTAALRENKVQAGQAELQDQLDVLRGAFNTLNEKRAIPSTDRNMGSNLLSYIQGTGIGQVAGRIGGSKEQVERDVINSAKQRLVQAIKTASGMSSQQLNSNFELKTMLNSLSDVNLGYEASMRIIDNIENTYVKGVNAKKPMQLSGEDKKALDWANANPNDPRSAQIKRKLGL